MNRTAPLLTGLAALGVAACATSNQSSTIKNTGTPTGDALVVTPAAAPVSAHTAHAGGGIEACPVMGHGAPAAALAANAAEPTDDLKVADWWPNRLDLSILRMNSEKSDPMGDGFDYRAEFEKVDLAALKADIAATMTDSQEWWPADWGTYAGLFIRMAWHSAGTYRNTDGRGGSADGALRFAPLNSWPDNANLDKSRRLLWPVKKKYGRAVSWADLMVLAGNVALERSGFETLGFAGGREDVWEPQEDVFWGPEGEWLADERYEGDRELQGELAAVQMGLIYVNPEGPNGNPDPIAAARDIRETFGRMAMNDEETAALIAGGHTLGKAHGAGAASNVGPEPEGASITEQGFGWTSSYGTGAGKDAITSGLEGAWTSTPTEWSSEYLENLWGYEWEMTKSPAGATQWTPKGGPSSVPDAHVDGKRNKVVMFTTDLALREDPAYAAITQRWLEDPELFDAAFASAWYKLTHRDMGPVARLLGDEVAPAQLWQDPVPAVDHALVGNAEVADLKKSILATGLSPQQLVSVAWASASTYRGSDMRGGANGARIALAPQTGWAANDPNNLEKVLGVYGLVQSNFNEAREDGMKVSLADLIVLGGCAGVEEAARAAGMDVTVPFTPGRTDATAEMTDAASFAVLEPRADAFRNYFTEAAYMRPAEALVDRAQQLELTVPEMTALLGGMRAIGANAGGSTHGVLTSRPGALTNDFFVNLLDMGTQWQLGAGGYDVFVGTDRATGAERWTATSVDLIFGSNSELRAVAEVYASDDAQEKFVNDFVAAWDKVMMLDRFDVDRR